VIAFARSHAASLGDPHVRRVLLVLGPRSAAALGGPRLSRHEALIVMHGRFSCRHCWIGNHVDDTVDYVVAWPYLAVRSWGGGTNGINLPPQRRIAGALTITTG
jgi:hypothetical protein